MFGGFNAWQPNTDSISSFDLIAGLHLLFVDENEALRDLLFKLTPRIFGESSVEIGIQPKSRFALFDQNEMIRWMRLNLHRCRISAVCGIAYESGDITHVRRNIDSTASSRLSGEIGCCIDSKSEYLVTHGRAGLQLPDPAAGAQLKTRCETDSRLLQDAALMLMPSVFPVLESGKD